MKDIIALNLRAVADHEQTNRGRRSYQIRRQVREDRWKGHQGRCQGQR